MSPGKIYRTGPRDHNKVEKDDGGSLTAPKNDDMDTSKASKTGR